MGSFTERFWRHVDRTDTSGCWLWRGKTNGRYGRMPMDGRLMVAHRISYLLNIGNIPDDMCVLHRCDVTRCVRPDHLFVGTHTDNMRDAAKKKRLWQYTQPDQLIRKGRHWSHIHPEQAARGSDNGASKVTPEIVREIRARYAAGGITISKLGVAYGLTFTPTWKIIRRVTWAHVV